MVSTEVLYECWCDRQEKLKEKDEEIKELREILLEVGAGHPHNKRLYEWYCKNK